MNNFSEWVNQITGNDKPLFFMLGPCSMENELHTLKVAEFLKELSNKLGFSFIFKSSFDKANRISIKGYRSVGLEEGLQILNRVREEFHVPIVTDVHETWQADAVGAVADVIQIPAFLCRQTDLLVAAGKTGKPVFIKKGQFATTDVILHGIEKVHSSGNQRVWAGERGVAFGYNNLVVDYRNFPIMKAMQVPVIFDVTHAVQRPGGLGHATGGDRHFVPTLAAAAVVQGIAGLFMEVHEEPEVALSDGPNSVRLSDLERLISYLMQLDEMAKSSPVPTIA